MASGRTLPIDRSRDIRNRTLCVCAVQYYTRHDAHKSYTRNDVRTRKNGKKGKKGRNGFVYSQKKRKVKKLKNKIKKRVV